MDAPALHPRARLAPGHYGALLVVVVVAFALIPFGDGQGISTARAIYMTALALAAFRVASSPRRVLHLGLGLAASAIVIGILADAANDNDLRGVASLMAASVTLVVIGAILVDLGRAPAVTAETIAGVVSVYLLIGFFFGTVYGAVDVLQSGAFSSSIADLSPFDLTYFSFVTLTTTGYGDITPATDLTRTLAVGEAMIGQVFLVTVVARAVSMLGQEKKRVRRGTDADKG